MPNTIRKKTLKIKKVLPLIQTLNKLNSKDRLIVLEYCNDEVYEFISECVYNAIRNKSFDHEVKKCLKTKLSPDQDNLRYIANRKKPIHLRRKKVLQSGGNISTILEVLAPIAAQLLIGLL